MDGRVDFSIVEKIVYINLNKRADRNDSILKELKNLQIEENKFERFEAIEDSRGYLGCAKSHAAVLKKAIDNGWENILILEDDMVFWHDAERMEIVNSFFSMLKKTPWDVAFLSASYFETQSFSCNKHFLKVNRAYCACAYIVNRKYYQTLLDNFSEAIRIMETLSAPGNNVIDVYWLPLMQKDKWFGVHPNFGYQQAGDSNIRNGHSDLEYFFSKPLEAICQGTYNPEE